MERFSTKEILATVVKVTSSWRVFFIAGKRLSSHSVLNPANEKPDGEQFPTTEERQPNVSKNVDIPIFKVSGEKNANATIYELILSHQKG